jgi:serine/threonine kinase 32
VDWWSLGVVFYECIYNKRPFEAQNHEQLSRRIRAAEPAFPVTNPPVSNPCLHAISSLLERDKTQRIGAAGFGTFTDSPFFRVIDFVALENKEIDPTFLPSSEKTNFDATYDLEELLLEEAPLEARARRQKPREQLKHDASATEIRADELHRMIETMFEPFDYTTVQFDRQPSIAAISSNVVAEPTSNQASPSQSHGMKLQTHNFSYPNGGAAGVPAYLRPDEHGGFTGMERARSGATTANASPNGSPPLPSVELMPTSEREPPRSIPQDYFAPPPDPRNRIDSRSSSKARRPFSRSRRAQDFQSQTSSVDGSTEPGELGAPPPLPNPFLASGPSTPGEEREKRPSGMLAFLSRKKGRDRSPKARERGVLGKEGARVVVGP